MTRPFSIFALVVALAGCAGAGPAGAAPAASRAEELAAAMAAAAAAEAAGDARALARALGTVEALGAKPLEAVGEDPLPAWRSAARTDPTPPLRGRPLGPGYRSGRVAPGSRDSFSQLFLSGSGATIALSAPQGEQLLLAVKDPHDKPVCQVDARRERACHWVPMFTQRYTIEVHNPGVSDARYFLVVE